MKKQKEGTSAVIAAARELLQSMPQAQPRGPPVATEGWLVQA
ncbi:MAG: hypothetical protein AABX69_04035 [Nanoarchaeota archaeon]